MTKPVCPCGSPLSKYNRGPFCFKCQQIQAVIRTTDDPGAKKELAARFAVGVYCHPARFSSPERYLKELTQRLDELAVTVGLRPPETHDVWEVAR